MKKQFSKILFIFLLLNLFFSSSSWAGQVVTDEIKLWAKKAIEQEKALPSSTAPANSVAVLYFSNKTNMSDLNLLEKGLTLMLITDLHKVKEIKLMERVKLQALVSELELTASGLTDPKSSARMGKLLGAANLVGGNILDGKLKDFQLASNLLSVNDEKIFGQPEVQGKLLEELFKMEKDLVFEVIRLLKIQLSPEEELELRKPITSSIRALVFFFQAIEYSDAGNYAKAQEYYEKALAEDPNFDLAKMGLLELQNLGLVIVRAEAYSEYEDTGDMTDLIGHRKTTDLKDKSEIEKILNQSGSIETKWNIEFDMYSHIKDNLTDDMVVDFDGIDDDIQKAAADDATMDSIGKGEYISETFDKTKGNWAYTGVDTPATYSFWSGNYEYGFQTVGQNQEVSPSGEVISTPFFLSPGTLQSGIAGPGDSRISLAALNGQGLEDGFLAYAVQLEEDRMNKKILEMHREYVDQDKADVIDAIKDALGKTALRNRDGWFIQHSDAQAGRVLKDNDGNWTRVQQYVLRPDPKTVQMLNVSLRKGPSVHAGFSSINWTTVLNDDYHGDLRKLPWSSWLDTKGEDSYLYISSDHYTHYPEKMSVEFLNAQGEALKETRHFISRGKDMTQGIDMDVLEVGNEPYTNTYGDNGYNQYDIRKNYLDDTGFNYFVFETETIIDVSFTIYKDMNISEDLLKQPVFSDIWDVLRVNENGAPNIGNNCLGITIGADSTLFTNPIDVIYIPMSRMLWKEYEN